MKKSLGICIAVLMGLANSPAWATNGDNLIGIGAVNRSMGGVGVAAPQDSITAIFVNPAAMGACPCGEKNESIFSGTIFDPTVSTKITTPFGVLKADSGHAPFVIPAVGVVTEVNEKTRFGIGFYGVSGLGVDYRNQRFDLDGNPANGYEGDLVTKLEVMKFSPMLSYELSPNFSLGAAVQVSYQNLDLGQGGSHDYAYGGQVGAHYSNGGVYLGASYSLPQEASHERVFNFDAFMGDTTLDTLDLEAPAVSTVGAAYELTPDWLIAADVKHVAWSDAAGYKDFDWNDQYVFALGTRYSATEKLDLRAGYNYGENPVEKHDGWNPQGVSTVQGKAVPTFGYEMLRTVGFPAIVEQHVTVGAGYELKKDMEVSVSYMHAFAETFSETSAGGFFTLESSLEEDSVSVGMNWLF